MYSSHDFMSASLDLACRSATHDYMSAGEGLRPSLRTFFFREKCVVDTLRRLVHKSEVVTCTLKVRSRRHEEGWQFSEFGGGIPLSPSRGLTTRVARAKLCASDKLCRDTHDMRSWFRNRSSGPWVADCSVVVLLHAHVSLV